VQYNHDAGVKARGHVPEECVGHAAPADACELCDLVEWRGALAAFLLRPNAATQAHVDALKRKVPPPPPSRTKRTRLVPTPVLIRHAASTFESSNPDTPREPGEMAPPRWARWAVRCDDSGAAPGLKAPNPVPAGKVCWTH
jgi:hypothetical protein